MRTIRAVSRASGPRLCAGISTTTPLMRSLSCRRMTPDSGSITCDGTKVGYFWSEALGWPLVWDQDEETAIRAPDGSGPFITWGPPLAAKIGKNRLHLDIAPPDHIDQRAEVDRLVSLGANRIEIGQGEVDWVVMADPDDNEFCVLSPR